MNKRVEVIDKLRFFAICGVVLIHTSTRILERTSYNLDVYWISLLLNQLARFAVPLFFLISGLVLELTSPEKINIKIFLKKRFSKILIPYIFWSLIYYFFVYTNNHDNFLTIILSGEASYQLYFIPTLCIFYLLFPILHKLYSFISNAITLGLFAIIELELLYHDYFVLNIQAKDTIRIAILGLFYFIAGMVISHNLEIINNFIKRWQNLIRFAAIGWIVYLFKEGVDQYKLTYNINAFYSSWRPSVFVYTFLGGSALATILNKFNFHKLSNLSFLVFFIHVLILECVWKWFGNYVSPYLIFDLFIFVTVTAVSFGLAYIIHKIPHVSKLTG